MFEKSRRKIVATIMLILTSVWIGTLGVIYASSYMEMSRQNIQMLKLHAQMYELSQTLDNKPPERPIPDVGKPEFEPEYAESPRFQLSTFYTVALSYKGEVLEIKNDQSAVHTDAKLQALAQEIIDSGKDSGRKGNLAFYAADKGGYMLVAFMDNTVIDENTATLMRYTVIFGGATIIAFFFLSVLLAKKIVQPLEESYQKQKQFISDAGHELKTPVSVISANAELLEREIGDSPWLSNIQYENERMGLLVAQLLELARTEQVSPQMEQIDISRLCNGEILPFESVAFEKGLHLYTDIEEGIQLVGNSAQLKQLVSILVDNAIRHSSGGAQIGAYLSRERGVVKLSVINPGEPISQKQREQIFERFYRVDTARNSEDKHYGLGLAIAKAIVTAHKGQIEVLCYDGLVEFQVRLPISQA